MNFDKRKKDVLGAEVTLMNRKLLDSITETVFREIIINEHQIENPNYFARAFSEVIAMEFVEYITNFRLQEIAREEGLLPKNPNARAEYVEILDDAMAKIENSFFDIIDRIEIEKIVPMAKKAMYLRFETFNYNDEKEFPALFDEICQIQEEIDQMNKFDWVFLDARNFALSTHNKNTKRVIKSAGEKKKEEWRRLEYRIEKFEKKLQNFYQIKEEAEAKEKKRQEVIEAKKREKAERAAIAESSQNTVFQVMPQGEDLDSVLLRVYKISRHLDALADKPKEAINIEKLEKLRQTLDELLAQNEKVNSLIEDCHHQLNFLLSPEFAEKDNQEKNEISKNNQNEIEKEEKIAKPLDKNTEMIELIDLLLEKFDYTVSNTRANTKSFGDGSFVTKIFRPFLRGLRDTIFAQNKIILTDEFSWAEIIEAYKTHIDDKDAPRQLFIGLLSNQTQKVNTIAELKKILIDVTRDFSEKNFYNHEGNKDKTSLKTILTRLSKMP